MNGRMAGALEASPNHEGTGPDFVSSHNRIAARYPYESRILVRFCRDDRKHAAEGWARDLSESGLGAFVAKDLVIGEQVTLQIRLRDSGKEEIVAKVARQVGTQYGFQFIALSAQQRLGIQAALEGQTPIPYRQLGC